MSCGGYIRVDLQRLMGSRGMPSVPGALPKAKLSIALLSSSVGSGSKSSMIGRGSVASSAE